MFQVPFAHTVIEAAAKCSSSMPIHDTADALRTVPGLWESLEAATRDGGGGGGAGAGADWPPPLDSSSATGFAVVLQVLVVPSGGVFVGYQHGRAFAPAVVREGVRLLRSAHEHHRRHSAGCGPLVPLRLMQTLVHKTHEHNLGVLRAIAGHAGHGGMVVRLSLRPLAALTIDAAHQLDSPWPEFRLRFANTHANALIVRPGRVVLVEPTLAAPLPSMATLMLRLAPQAEVLTVHAPAHGPAADLPLCTVTAAVVALAILANMDTCHSGSSSQTNAQNISDWAHDHMHWFLRLLGAAVQCALQ